jgi:hypothetical protein
MDLLLIGHKAAQEQRAGFACQPPKFKKEAISMQYRDLLTAEPVHGSMSRQPDDSIDG